MPLFGPPNIEKMKEKGDVNGLIKALSHENLEIVKDAAAALGQIGDARAVEPLIASLKHFEVEFSLTTLKQIGEPAVQPLISALKGDDADVRRYVAWTLGKIRDPRYVEPLIAALTDKEVKVRHGAVNGLGMFGDPRAIEPLIATINDTDENIRASVVDALGNIRDPRVVEPLIAALKDKSSVVRWYSARVFEKRCDLRAMDPLTYILNNTDEEKDVRKAADNARYKLEGPPVLSVNDDDTVTDTRFGLIWQRADDDTKHSYEEALAYCRNLKLAGYNDWRLPAKTELQKIATRPFEELKQFFPGVHAERYWAQATADQLRWAEVPERIAYTLDFDPESGNYQKPITYFKTNSYFVRAVRNVM